MLLVVSLGLGLFYRYSLGFSAAADALCRRANALIAAGLAVGILLFQDKIIAILSDPGVAHRAHRHLEPRCRLCATISGHRCRIWLVLADRHQSPVFRLTSISWLIRTSHSHSGYLELMATTGVPGLFFGLLALVVAPFVKFMHLDSSNRNIKAALYSIWIFALLFNFMETQIFTRDRQIWLMLIIVIASLRCMEYDDRWPTMSASSPTARRRRHRCSRS